MSIVINTNASATAASNNLNASNAMLQKSLNRLSSGSKITAPADDAGGLAVSMKMQAAIKRTEAVNTNIANAQSFLQTQDGALATGAKILDRISELKTLSMDVTKNDEDIANYQTEYDALKSQLTALTEEKFNGVSLFTSAATGTTLAVATTEKGDKTVNLTQAAFADKVSTLVASSAKLQDDTTPANEISVDNVTTAIQSIATLRAQNGATSSRLQFASEMLSTNKQNLEAANSRIIDVDVASESTQLARANILVQAGSSMLGQANASSQIALRLLG